MKKTLLTFCVVLGALHSNAQVTTYVTQPPSLEGAQEFTWADNWGQTPDLNDPANSVTAFAAFVDDGTAADSLGCEALINGADITGKIAVVYRGSCEFGMKSLNAQNAGALAVVIINNSGAPVAMGAGAVGGEITIPVVMISTAAGALLRDEIIAGNVEMLIGSVLGVYEYNLFVDKATALIPQYAALPASLANASGFTMDVGTWVRNFGSLDQSDVVVNLTITNNGTELYNESTSPTAVSNNDSAYFALPLFTQTAWSGFYEGVYTVSSSNAEGFPSDNNYDFNFLADSLFTYAKVDGATKTPLQESFVRATLDAPSYQVCEYFSSPMASMYQIEGLYTGATKSGNASMDGEVLEARIFEWNDVFTGWADATTNDIAQLTTADYFYEDSIGGLTVYIPFNEPFVMENDKRYLFCAYSPATDVFLGMDGDLDYNRIQADLDEPIYLMSDNGAWGSFTNSSYCGIGVKMTSAIVGINEQNRVDITPFPNPTNDFITIPLTGQSGAAMLQMFDLSGKKVAEQKVAVANNGKVNVDVSNIATGTYLFNMNFENGQYASFRVVVTK